MPFLLEIRVRPNTSRNKVGGSVGQPPRLVVAVQAPAVDGKANQAVIKELAKAFDLRARDFTIVFGGAVSPDSLEFSLLLTFGFIAAVIGGLESLPGAVLGALVLGLVLAAVQIYISGTLVFMIAFALLLLVLLVRPQGFIGAKAGRRA